MPMYEFLCESCNHTFDKFLSISNRESPISEPCPSCNELKVQKHVGRINMVQWDTHLKPDDNFRDLLRQIKKNNRGSTIDDKFGS